ncbi:MAG: DEAD/DEAH box helicase [Acidobacteria bacterium]|nr:DEAD/DEAH box helicase [Acidobacteriota bacterium]
MTVAVAPTFFASADKLESGERARVFDFLAKFYENPAHPSLSLERVVKRDPKIWSARITQELRAIVHRDGDTNLLLYAGHHDDAYQWAERRRVENHPVTGALQVIEVAETAREELSWAAEAPKKKGGLLKAHADDYLESLGVPADWLPVLRAVETDDQLLEVAAKLPSDLAERLLRVASGELVTPPTPVAPKAALTADPEAPRRFWVVGSAAELVDLLAKPIEAWVRFLHPTQRQLVEGAFKGPVKVTGGAGTGKTVVAMHRARFLARSGKRVLLTSFVHTLCRNIDRNLRILCTDEERKRLSVETVDAAALGLVRASGVKASFATSDDVRAALKASAVYAGATADPEFLEAEWDRVIATQGLLSWPEYRDAQRTGRGRPLSASERKQAWAAFERTFERLESAGKLPSHVLMRRAAEAVAAGRQTSPYDAVIVDELQDLTPAAVRFVATLATKAPANLMLLGDGGQRIYPGGFTLKGLGVDVRGRSKVLRLNYRTTRQIQRAADRVLGLTADDLDGGTEDRSGTQSLLAGPVPSLRGFKTEKEHDAFLVSEIRSLLKEGLASREIAVFARTADAVKNIRDCLHKADVPYEELDRDTDVAAAQGVCLGTMHRAKGLEFKAVLVARCDDGSLPPAAILARTKDAADREAIVTLHRQLLYVALTRARDEATVTWVGKPSPFLAPLLSSGESNA